MVKKTFITILLLIFFTTFSGVFLKNTHAWTESDLPVYSLTFSHTTPPPGSFFWPSGLFIDNNGNIFVGDRLNQRVQKFDSNGNFLMQFGTAGTGNGQFNGPSGVFTDNVGNIYVADRSNNRIQKFDSVGNFLMTFGSSGSDDGQFSGTFGVYVDSNGYIYCTDTGNNRVQKFDSNGDFVMKFGTTGSAAGQLNTPRGIYLDSSGYIYVAEYGNNRVQKFTPAGASSLIIGSGILTNAVDVKVDPSGNIYAAEYGSHQISKFNSSGVLQLVFGSYGSLNGQFLYPIGVALDPSLNIWVLDYMGMRVQKFSPTGVYMSKFGHSSTLVPDGVALDSNNNVFIVDRLNSIIEKFNSSGQSLMKFGTSGTDNGQFNDPDTIAIDSQNNIYIGERNGNRIQKFDANGNFLTTFGSGGSGNGQFNKIDDLCLDTLGNIYVADAYNYRIQKFTPAGTYIMQFKPITGTMKPYGVFVDSNGYVYVADANNNKVRKFASDGTEVLVFGSSGSGDGQLTAPDNIKVDPSGYIYVADTSNHRIQKFDSAGNFVSKFGTNGTGDYNFTNPFALTLHSDSQFEIFVSDYSNNRVQKFIYDRQAPTATIYALVNDRSNTTSFNITGNVVDGLTAITSAEYQLDNTSGSWSSCAASDMAFDELNEDVTCSLSGLTEGSHTLYLRSTDSKTNTVTSYPAYSFVVDLTNPTINITNLGLINNVPDQTYLAYYFTSQTPFIQGITEANSTVHFKYGLQDYTAVADGTGHYGISIEGPSLPRIWVTLKYYAVDLAGNLSEERTLVLIVGIENFPVGSTGEPVATPTVSITPTITITEIPQTGDITPTPILPTIVIYRVEDSSGNLLVGAIVTIDRQQYISDDKGQIYVQGSIDNNPVITIEYNGEVLSANISGSVISSGVAISQNTNLNCIFLILLMILLVAGAYAGYRYRRTH